MCNGDIAAADTTKPPQKWTDADWFVFLWNKIIPSKPENPAQELVMISSDAAENIAVLVYNNFVVHKVLRRCALPFFRVQNIHRNQCMLSFVMMKSAVFIIHR